MTRHIQKVSIIAALVGTFSACRKEESNRTASMNPSSGDVLVDPTCSINVEGFPQLASEHVLNGVLLTDSLNKTKSICEMRKEQSASNLLVFSLMRKDSVCKDCWKDFFEKISQRQNEDNLDVFSFAVRATEKDQASDHYLPLPTSFGIVTDSLRMLYSLIDKDELGKVHNAVLVMDQRGRAIFVSESEMKDFSSRLRIGDALSTLLDDIVVEKKSEPSNPIEPDRIDTPDPDTVTPDLFAEGLKLISVETMKTELAFIAQDRLQGRLSATAGQKEAAEYLKGIINAHGVKSLHANGFEQTFALSVGPLRGQNTSNLIAKIEGSDPVLKNEYIVIGAHMDHAGTLDLGYTCSAGPSGDRICNGADDNGSGSIAVLNVMKALSKAKKDLKRSVLIFWFSGEEEGLLGSYHYVNKNPIVPLNAIKYMVNLDMVGYIHTNGKRLGALGGQTSTTASNILKAIDTANTNFAIQITSSAGGGSDHVPFMEKGIPGVFFHTGVSNNPNYHRTGDSHDKVDYEGMKFAATTSYELIYKLATQSDAFAAQVNAPRMSLITEEERLQTCHHLMQNPYVNLLSHP